MRDMHTDEDGLKFDIGACVTEAKMHAVQRAVQYTWPVLRWSSTAIHYSIGEWESLTRQQQHSRGIVGKTTERQRGCLACL